MPYRIGKQDDRYCVEKYSATGAPEAVEGGCHATEAEANDQMRTLYANAEKSLDGAMLAFYPSGDVCQMLYQATVDAQVTPEAVGELHLTLVHLGEGVSPEQENALITLLRDFADHQQGLNATINGTGRFRNTDLNAVYANVDSGSLPTLRQDLWNLVKQCGIEAPSDHGFTPHITLAYVPNDLPIKEIVIQPTFVQMAAITLVVGDRRTTFQLAGYPREPLMEEKNTPASSVPDATPLQGPYPGNPAQFGVLSAPGVRGHIQKLVARFLKKKQPALGNKGYISPAPLGGQKTGVSVFKGSHGLRYMVIITSNSYKDREQETITTKALQSYVDKAWVTVDKCLPENPLLFWHNGDPIGDIVACDMEGPFLIEVAQERKNKAIRLSPTVKTTIKAVWNAIERAKTTRWGASHGYEYPPAAKDKEHVYHAIKKFETSVLPLKNAANPYTFSGVINMNERDKFINKLLGISDVAANIRKGVRSVERDLENQGLQHKEIKVKGVLQDLEAAVDEFLAKVTDNPDPATKQELIETVISALAGGDPDEVDEDETDTELGDTAPPSAAPQMDKAYKLIDALVTSQAHQDEQMNRIVKAIEGLAPITELPAKVDKQFKALEDRLVAVEKRLGGRPRAASRDVETAVEDKALTEKVLEQAAEVDAFWGARVTPNK